MLVVTNEPSSLFGNLAGPPRFSFHEPTFAQVVVEQIDAAQYSLAHFRIIWHQVDVEEIHARAEYVWQRKRPWFCTFI